MRGQIEKVAVALIGTRLWACRRAADMATFQFGARKEVSDFFGRPSEVGEYALHVQCAWRIARGDQTVVGSRDLYFPASYKDITAEVPPEFDWDRDPNLRDRLLLSLFDNGTREFAVRRVEVGAAGALRILLSDGLCLDVVPDTSLELEHWRLFRPGVDGPHLVVGGAPIDRDSG